MTSSDTPRRILQDLPVNAFGTPSASNFRTSSSVGLKRQFHEVEDPSLPPAPLRSRITDYKPRLGPNVCQTFCQLDPILILTDPCKRRRPERLCQEQLLKKLRMQHGMRTRTRMRQSSKVRKIPVKVLGQNLGIRIWRETQWTRNRRKQQR